MEAYTAATMKPLQRLSPRGEVKSADEPASRDSAILSRALALRRSTAMYKRYVNMGNVAKLGSREKSGRNRGA